MMGTLSGQMGMTARGPTAAQRAREAMLIDVLNTGEHMLTSCPGQGVGDARFERLVLLYGLLRPLAQTACTEALASTLPDTAFH